MVLRYPSYDNIDILENVSLAPHSSFRIGGAARYAAFPKSAHEIMTLLTYARERNLRTFLAGNATNLLFDDAGFDGLVIFTTAIKNVRFEEDRVIADAGASLTALAAEAMRRGLSGLEFAYGIPGTVGGAVYMNAGAYGGEIKDILTSSTYLGEDGISTRTTEDHHFDYRTSIYQKTGEVILSVEFALTKKPIEEIRAHCEKNMTARREKQPLEYPNAGSTFKRPRGAYAGALIEGAGLKGLRIGGAEVSEKHAGFIINRGGATSRDVLTLIETIREKVEKNSGIHLETEIIHVI